MPNVQEGAREICQMFRMGSSKSLPPQSNIDKYWMTLWTASVFFELPTSSNKAEFMYGALKFSLIGISDGYTSD